MLLVIFLNLVYRLSYRFLMDYMVELISFTKRLVLSVYDSITTTMVVMFVFCLLTVYSI